MKRGTIKAFREYLNKKYGFVADGKGLKGRYKATTRSYGDYLYSQDRDMFLDNLRQAITKECEELSDFVAPQ